MTNWRGLCAEHLKAWDSELPYADNHDKLVELLEATRTALSQPEPEVVGPSDKARELQWPPSVAAGCREAAVDAEPGSPLQQLLSAAGDLLEHYATPQSSVGCIRQQIQESIDQEELEFRELLERMKPLGSTISLSASPPPPVPVAERLPGPEDCDEKGRCWLFRVGMDGVGDWHQRAPYPSAASYQFFMITHWLPHNALPVPGAEVG
jgi:hypothetical protein